MQNTAVAGSYRRSSHNSRVDSASLRYLSIRRHDCYRRRSANNMSQPELTRSIVGASFILPVINGAMHIPPAVSATQVTLGDSQPVDIPILVLLFALHVLIDGK